MFVIRKLPVRSVSQPAVNNFCRIYKRNYVKSLSCLQAQTATKTCVGKSWTTFSLLHRDDKVQIRCMCENHVSDDRLVNYKEFNKLLEQENTVVIDIRDEDEIRRTGSVPGSINIPLNDVKKALDCEPKDFENKYYNRKPEEVDTIVFMCRRGKRSLEAVDIAIKEGYTNSKSFDGGFIQWLDCERQRKKY